jgi:hypothetical protein
MWQSARSGPAHQFFSIVASCGLVPRTTRPGPRAWTAFWSVAGLASYPARRADTLIGGATGVQHDLRPCPTDPMDEQ